MAEGQSSGLKRLSRRRIVFERFCFAREDGMFHGYIYICESRESIPRYPELTLSNESL